MVTKEEQILKRIQDHYGKKLGRDISFIEAKDIAKNLLSFAKAIHGKKPQK